MKFLMKLIDLCSGLVQGLPSLASNPIDPSLASTHRRNNRLQQATPFQPMQQRIQRPRPNAISMMCQLLHHRQSEDRLMSRMHKHVDPYQPEKKLPLLLQHKTNIPLQNRPVG